MVRDTVTPVSLVPCHQGKDVGPGRDSPPQGVGCESWGDVGGDSTFETLVRNGGFLEGADGCWVREVGVSWVRPSPARVHAGREVETGMTVVVGAWETFVSSLDPIPVIESERHEQPRLGWFRRCGVLGILGFDVRRRIQSGRRKRVGNLKGGLPVRNILNKLVRLLFDAWADSTQSALLGDARTVQSA